MTAAFELYVDFMSQPSRACALMATLHPKLQVEVKPIFIHKKQNRTPAFLAMNPMATVPTLYDKNTRKGQPESCTIMRKLARMHVVPAHWYRDPSVIERVDAALDWHHSAIRAGEARLVWHRALAPNMGAKSLPQVAEEAALRLTRSLNELETYWLRDGPFVAGEQISIADLIIACEIEQLCLLPEGEERTKFHDRPAYPKVNAFMKLVRETVGAPWLDVTKHVHKVAAKQAQARLAASKL